MVSVTPMKYKSGYKYVLAETFGVKIPLRGYFAHTNFITLDNQGNLIIKDNYAWDGATMFPDLECVRRASLIHDALCQLIRLGLLPEHSLNEVHNVMKTIVQEDIDYMVLEEGAYQYISEIMYIGLSLAGGFGKGFENKIKIAPDNSKRSSFKTEIVKQFLDFRHYI